MLETYFRTVESKKYAPLTMAEEQELLKDWPSPQCKEKLANHNVRFVVDVAKKYLNDSTSMDDLIAFGNLGMVKALDNFQPEKNYKFITYAVWWIHRIIKHCVSEDRVIRVPHNMIVDSRRISGAANAFYDKHGYMPTIEETCEKVGMKPLRAGTAMRTVKNTYSLFAQDSNGLEIIEKRPNDEPLPDEDIESQQQTSIIEGMINRLSPREAEVIRRLYALDDEKETMQQIADSLNLSRERVRQIKEIALEKMRHSSNKVARELVV